MTATSVAPVSVVIPTVGRVGPLTACLESLALCRTGAAEIIVVDQSGDAAVEALVERFDSVDARLVPCAGSGVSRGRNVGIRAARNEIVLVTDDDCTVESNWVENAWRIMQADPRRILTGQVLPVGDPHAVPSVKVDERPHDFTGTAHDGALFANNMVLPRDLVLAQGGFDERFRPSEAAEDNDFCYRWLKAGGVLRFEPTLVVRHHDWRTPEELERLYVRYARGQGFLYAKHLRQGDLRMLRYIARDLYRWLRSIGAAALRGRKGWTDARRGVLRGLPGGLWYGWQVFFRGGATEPPTTSPPS